MSKELDSLKQTIFGLIHKSSKIQTIYAEVVDVNWENRTMTAIGLNEVAYFNILLGLGSFDLKPKKGTTCLIGLIDNNDTTPFLIMVNEVEEMLLNSNNGVFVNISDKGISIESRDKPIRVNSGNSALEITENGIDITSDKAISLNGGFEALYNKVPGMPISDVSQIGTSKKVKIG